MINSNKLFIFELQFLAISLFLIITQNQGFSQDIDQWSGVNRDGHYDDTGLLRQWPENGPELLWVYEELGKGFGAPTVSGNQIFINGEEDGKSYLFAFDLKGNLLWKTLNGEEFMGTGFSSTYPGTRSSPTVVSDLVYTTSGKGRIACYNKTTGKEIWALGMVNDLGGYENEFGYAESLLIDGNTVYCTPGGTETNVAALDRFTGKLIWSSKALGDTTSYCSPVMIVLPERKIFVNLSRHYLYGLDCKTGELLWSFYLEGFEYDGQHCNSPVYKDGYLYCISEEKEGKGLLKLQLSQDGKSIHEIWHNKQIINSFGGFVIHDDQLFTVIRKNYLKSIDLENGSVTDSVRIINGGIICADNLFITYSRSGDVNLIDYTDKKLNITGSFKMEKGSKEHFSRPVVANGVLYIRHGNALAAYKVK